jgi:mono/diheme cytochrome c family protein
MGCWFALVIVLASAMSAPAWAQDGEALFQRSCASCHGAEYGSGVIQS